MIGDPIAHSLSPRIHNAAFRALDLDWVFVALPVQRGQAAIAVDGIRSLGLRGVSVTMPHKESVIEALDGLTSAAVELGAVNCILRAPHDDALLLGDNTDGAGFLRGLKADLDIEATGRRFVVLGAGGAARAVVHALAGAGASGVTVVNRDETRGERAAALAASVGAFVAGDDARAISEAVSSADVVVNATPVGMGADEALPLDRALLRPELAVADLIYHPAVTSLMAVAAELGAPTANGVSMLVHQAAVAFEHWTGVTAPVDAMTVAATT